MDDAHRLNYQPESARLAPDGRTLAFGLADMGRPPSEIQVRDVTKEDPPTVVVSMPGKELSGWNWSPDGKRLSFLVWGDNDKQYDPYVVELATKKVQKVTLPDLRARARKVTAPSSTPGCRTGTGWSTPRVISSWLTLRPKRPAK